MDNQKEEYLTRDEVYFQNLPAWPEFDIYDKNIDGLVPTAKLESWEQFHEVVKTYRVDEEGAEYIFRGQHNFEWALQPTLDRMDPGAIQKDVANMQLRNFRLSIRGRVATSVLTDTNDEELWAVGQHHGLATPLLDWSYAPYVALFFAFVDEDPAAWKDKDGNATNHSRAIYILNKSFISDLVEDDSAEPLTLGYPKVVEPSKDDHGRLVNQAGLFTIAPYGETIESALLKALVASEVDVDEPKEVSKYICKIHIPNAPETRRDCLRHLRKMNIHHASLFPDVIGASGYCNELISEVIASRTNILTIKEEVQKTKRIPEKPPAILAKDFKLAETDDVLRNLIESLLVDVTVRNQVAEIELRRVARVALDFIENKAGPDWYDRASQLARLKNILRRQLKNVRYPDDHISAGAEALSLRAAEMSRSEEKKRS